MPEVSLVAILDADKEGFLRSTQSLTQTAGRAARHVDGTVILYADKITKSMERFLDETGRRRERQLAYNLEHNIIPRSTVRSNEDVFREVLGKQHEEYGVNDDQVLKVAEDSPEYLSTEKVKKKIKGLKAEMETAAKDLNFVDAARIRDEMFAWQKILNER